MELPKLNQKGNVIILIMIGIICFSIAGRKLHKKMPEVMSHTFSCLICGTKGYSMDKDGIVICNTCRTTYDTQIGLSGSVRIRVNTIPDRPKPYGFHLKGWTHIKHWTNTPEDFIDVEYSN